MMKRDVFISHAPSDQDAAEEILAALEDAGMSCWSAPRDIPAGMEWPAPIIDAILDARLFLLVLSGGAVRSVQIAREVQLAIDRHLPVLPVRIDASEPGDRLGFFLRRHTIFEAPPPLSARLPRLVDEVGTLLGKTENRFKA